MNFITFENRDANTLIEDVIVYPLKINKDASGVLVETLRKDWSAIYGPGREFFMQYYSITESGIARDENVWHYHPTVQDDRFLVIRGEIVVGISDNRENSSTKGLTNLFHMKADHNPYILLVPRKTLHGFVVVSKEPAILANFPTGLYNPQEEGRIPHEEAKAVMPDGSLFSWNMVRKEFSIPEIDNL